MHELDNYTIAHEPIKSIDLMERAARRMTEEFESAIGKDCDIVVFAGPGNNGGDALAMARMLTTDGYSVSVYLFNIKGQLSDDCTTNKQGLKDDKRLKSFIEITQEFDPPKLDKSTVVIDGLFGSGINKALTGGYAVLVKYINASPCRVVSIDIPSGLMPEDNSNNVRAHIIRATMTFTLQQPKLSFYYAENQVFLGEVRTLDIGISRNGMEEMEAQYELVEKDFVRTLLRPRSPFAHKGTMGSALLVAGSYGMAGAAVLAAKACLKTGVGKVTVHTPRKNNDIIQISIPEAIVSRDKDEQKFSESTDTEDFDALGIGPGLGQDETTAVALIAQLRRTQCPMVIDADALNILGSHRAWLQQLPKGAILTPHPKEFERLAGHGMDTYEQLDKARSMAKRMDIFIILKGHHTAICAPNGMIYINSTGNAGMATAGSGDVLTGIITSLLAQGYKREEACILGVYLHGLAGDIAANHIGEEGLTASDIIQGLPKAFKTLKAQ